MTIGFFILLSAGLFFFSYVSSQAMWLLLPSVLLFGIGYGGNNTLRAILLREYFGTSKLGTIYGFAMGILTIGGILGPLLAGWTFDTWGSYSSAWLLFALLNAVALIILATIKPVDKVITGGNVVAAEKI